MNKVSQVLNSAGAALLATGIAMLFGTLAVLEVKDVVNTIKK